MGGTTKKSKAGGKSKASKPKDAKPKDKPKEVDEYGREIATPPQDRVAAVRPFWESMASQELRVELLSATLPELQERAKEIAVRQRKQAAIEEAEFAAEIAAGAEPIPGAPLAPEPTMDEVLEEGMSRLQERRTWKLWQWPLTSKEFTDADSFRQYMEENHIEEHLRRLLPREEGRPVEKPAEAALRKRMADLLQKVHNNTRQLQDDVVYPKRSARGPRATPDQIHNAVRDTNIEVITTILQAMEEEHEYLYHSMLFPVTGFVCEMLPENSRDSSRAELFFEDLEKLAPTDVARICEWLTERVDIFSAKLKPEAKELLEEEEENGIGDVDLFTLVEGAEALEVNAKWLQHLQERLLGEDGHPRKVQDTEDPHRLGLVLEWVYGTIVSTAEKARDGAKRSLGIRPPTAQGAYDLLTQALQDQADWERRARAAKDLLNDMVRSRREAAQLAQQHDIKPIPTAGASENGTVPVEAELPDHVIEAMLQRELLLTNAKLHGLANEHSNNERKLRSLRTQLRQGEPGFERLKRELEELKNAPRGLEGTYRTAAEMERHRAQAADAAIEEQLEVQTAFREHGAKLQSIYEVKQRTESEMSRREQEMKQLSRWRATVSGLAEKFARPLPALQLDSHSGQAGALPDSNGHAHNGLESSLEHMFPNSNSVFDSARHSAMRQQSLHQQQQNDRQKNRLQFHKDVRRQLYSDRDDREIFSTIQDQLRRIDKQLEDGRAALQHLEMALINVACDDPGAAIGAHLVLPLLQERLDAKALDFADRRAVEAEEDIIRMEAMKEDQARLEREKRNKLKQKRLDRLRFEKEKAAAERLESEREAQEAALQAAAQLAESEEAARVRKELESEAARAAEEALMEARRSELLQEKDGYWSRRMAAEAEAEAAILAASTDLSALVADADVDSDHSESTSWHEDSSERHSNAQRSRTGRPEPSSAGQPLPYMNGHGSAAGSQRDMQQHPSHSHSYSRPRLRDHEGGRGRGRGPPQRPSRPSSFVAGAPAARAGISRSSSSMSDHSAAADGRREPMHMPIVLAPPPVQAPAPQPQAAHQAQHAQPQQQGPALPLPPPSAAVPIPPASLPAVKAEPEQKAAAGLAPQPLQSSPAQSSWRPVPIALPALPPAEAPQGPATPAVPREPEQTSSTAKSLVELPRLSSSGPLLQFGDVPIVMSEVQAPAREPSDMLSQPARQHPLQLQLQQQPLPAAPHASSAGLALPVRLLPVQPDMRHAPPQQQHHPQHPQPPPHLPSDAHRSLPDGAQGPPQQMRPQALAQLPRTSRNPPQRQVVMGPQGMLPNLPNLPNLRGAPPQEALHPGLAVPDYHSPLHSRPGSAHSPHGLPDLSHQHGPGMVSPAFPGGPQGFPPSPGHLHHLPPHQLPLQMGYPGAPPRGSPLPGQRGHFMPPGSPTGPMGRQNVLLPPFMTMPGPHLMPHQPVPPPNLGFAPQGPRQLPPGAGPQHPHMPAGLPYGLPNGHPLPGMVPMEARHLAAARQVTSLRANAPAFVPRGAPDWSSDSPMSSQQQPMHLGRPSSATLHPHLSHADHSPGFFRPQQQSRSVQPGSQPPVQESLPEAAPMTVPGPSRPAPEAEAPQAQQRMTALSRPSLTQLPSQASGGTSSAPEASTQGSEASEPQDAPQPSTSDAESSQMAARIRSSEPAQVSTTSPALQQPPGSRDASHKPSQRGKHYVGGLLWEGFLEDLLRTRLVRGLRNDSGLNNCFLNVVLQCLWHATAFRGAVLGLSPAALEQCGPGQDAAVLQALHSIFLDFASPPDQGPAGQAAAPLPAHTPGAMSQVKRAKHEVDDDTGSARSSRGWTVSPAQLREALSRINHAAIHFELSEMHDAAEVLGEVFASLHRAQLGPAADTEPDVQLPQRIRVPHGAAPPRLAATTSTMVLDMFGQTVQADVPAAGEASMAARRSKGSPKGAVGQWQEVPLRSSSPSASAAANGQHPRLEGPDKPFHGTQLLQFTKFAHLVPARGLLLAHEHMHSASFEEMLCEADSASSPPRRAPGASARTLPLTLLQAPSVFVLALVWESPQASSSTIAATVDALSERLDLGKVFRKAPTAAAYTLRGIICYFSHHYQALVLSEELQQWLLYDDTMVKQLGSWRDVQSAMIAARMQPSLLFFERT